MDNFKVKANGKEYWISRSIAVVIFVTSLDKDFNKFILAVKRGKGVDNTGLWCCPCGYLNFDETLEDAAKRELFEETGYILVKEKLSMFHVDSVPLGKQNVTVRYQAYVDDMKTKELTTEFSEKDEVEEIKWINVKDVDQYSWAFGHKEIIKERWSNYNEK